MIPKVFQWQKPSLIPIPLTIGHSSSSHSNIVDSFTNPLEVDQALFKSLRKMMWSVRSPSLLLVIWLCTPSQPHSGCCSVPDEQKYLARFRSFVFNLKSVGDYYTNAFFGSRIWSIRTSVKNKFHTLENEHLEANLSSFLLDWSLKLFDCE